MDSRVKKRVNLVEIVEWILISLVLFGLVTNVDGQPFRRPRFRSFNGQAQRALRNGGSGQGQVHNWGQSQRRSMVRSGSHVTTQSRQPGAQTSLSRGTARGSRTGLAMPSPHLSSLPLLRTRTKSHPRSLATQRSWNTQPASGLSSIRAARTMMSRNRETKHIPGVMRGRSGQSVIRKPMPDVQKSPVVTNNMAANRKDHSRGTLLRMEPLNNQPSQVLSAQPISKNKFGEILAAAPSKLAPVVQQKVITIGQEPAQAGSNNLHNLNIDQKGPLTGNDLTVPVNDRSRDRNFQMALNEVVTGVQDSVVDISQGAVPSVNRDVINLSPPASLNNMNTANSDKAGGISGLNANDNKPIQHRRIHMNPHTNPDLEMSDIQGKSNNGQRQRRLILIRGKDGKLRRYDFVKATPAPALFNKPKPEVIINHGTIPVSNTNTQALQEGTLPISKTAVTNKPTSSVYPVTALSDSSNGITNVNHNIQQENTAMMIPAIDPVLPPYDVAQFPTEDAGSSLSQYPTQHAGSGLPHYPTQNAGTAMPQYPMQEVGGALPQYLPKDVSIAQQQYPTQDAGSALPQYPIQNAGTALPHYPTQDASLAQPHKPTQDVFPQQPAPVINQFNQPHLQIPPLQPKVSNNILDIVNSLMGSTSNQANIQNLQHTQTPTSNVPPPSIVYPGSNPLLQVGNNANLINWNLGMTQQLQRQAALQNAGVPIMGNMLPWYAQNNFIGMGEFGGIPRDSAQMQELMYGDTTDPPDIPDPTPKPTQAPVADAVVETTLAPTQSTKAKPKQKAKRIKKRKPKHKRKSKAKPAKKPQTPRPPQVIVTAAPTINEATTTSSVHDLAEQIIAALFGPQAPTAETTQKPTQTVMSQAVAISDTVGAVNANNIKAKSDVHTTSVTEQPLLETNMVFLSNKDKTAKQSTPFHAQLQPLKETLAPTLITSDKTTTKTLEASLYDIFGNMNIADITQLIGDAPTSNVKATKPEISPFVSGNDLGGLSIQKVPTKASNHEHIGVAVPLGIEKTLSFLPETTKGTTTTLSSIDLVESALNSVVNGSNAGIFDLLNNINLLWDVKITAPQTTTVSTTKTTTTTPRPTTTTTTPMPTTTTTLPPTTTTTAASVLDFPIGLIVAFLKSQRQVVPPVEQCTPQSPNFVCMGKDMFATIADIGVWCKDMCTTGSCMDAICSCSCPKRRRRPLPKPKHWQRRRQNRNRMRKTNQNLWSRTTTEEPPEEEEIEAEDMPSTTVAYPETTPADWWGMASSTQSPFGAAFGGQGSHNQVRNNKQNAHVTELPILAWASQLKAQLEEMKNKASGAQPGAADTGAVASLFEIAAPTTPKPPPNWGGTRWALPPPPPKATPTTKVSEEQPQAPVEWSRRWPDRSRRRRPPTTPPTRDWGTTESGWPRRRSRWNEPPPQPTPWDPRPNPRGNQPEWGGGSRDTWREPVPGRGSDRWGSEPSPGDPWGSRWEPPPPGRFRLRNKWSRSSAQSSEEGGQGGEPPDK